ncbi:tubulin polyglutamylase complex subunit 2 [Ceratitis capitata]|uniref:Tubulin polyglutamylase complex subunit 2 n=1 Tax=Ceratitis capitata TaxID=7213 RepID=W8BN64_CERCA|nr:tubulin polyglutamylase complex subunit 2 [Ceratitis capitata]
MTKKLASEDIFYDHLTLGLMGTLAKIPRVCNVRCEHRKPCEKTQIVNWEQRHTMYLPEDMKKFYLSSDGFLLQWSYQYAPGDLRRVGYIHIPPLQQITLLRESVEPSSSSATANTSAVSLCKNLLSTTKLSAQSENSGAGPVVDDMVGAVGGIRIVDEVGTNTIGTLGTSSPLPKKDRWSNPLPNITTKTKIFEINNVNEVAKVCMLFEANSCNLPKFYLYELNTMKWTFLSDTFSEYLRMAIAHLGLPYWELCFSNIGLPSWTEQLFLLLAPHLLEDYEPRQDRQVNPSPEHPYNIIDSSVFRIKPKTSVKSAVSRKNAS